MIRKALIVAALAAVIAPASLASAASTQDAAALSSAQIDAKIAKLEKRLEELDHKLNGTRKNRRLSDTRPIISEYEKDLRGLSTTSISASSSGASTQFVSTSDSLRHLRLARERDEVRSQLAYYRAQLQ